MPKYEDISLCFCYKIVSYLVFFRSLNTATRDFNHLLTLSIVKINVTVSVSRFGCAW